MQKIYWDLLKKNHEESKKRRIEILPKISYVSHELDLDPWLTLEENIQFAGMLYDIDTETINTRLTQYARELHLTRYLKKLVKKKLIFFILIDL